MFHIELNTPPPGILFELLSPDRRERIVDNPYERNGVAKIAAEISHEVKIEKLPETAVPGRLPLVPGHPLEPSVHAGGLQFDEAIETFGSLRVERKDVETRSVNGDP